MQHQYIPDEDPPLTDDRVPPDLVDRSPPLEVLEAVGAVPPPPAPTLAPPGAAATTDRQPPTSGTQPTPVPTGNPPKTQGLVPNDAPGPRPAPKPAGPAIRILDGPPPTLTRPLQLIDGRAYAVTWLYTEATYSETIARKTGEIVRLNPPRVETARRLHVVRDDGVLFGDGGDQPLEALGLSVNTAALELSNEHTWRAVAVKHYCAGKLPDLADVYGRLVQVYDHYVDFSRSLAEQEAMCRLSACLSLMTWFAPAFTVLPYVWANGEWGSGKTKWLTIWARTSYLGRVITWGGTFAALRDLADQGATLAFDDAETIDDPKADPDKRALLLAGNRRDAQVPLKEPAPDGKRWPIRWVNAFCPRGFSAKRRPVGALEQRTIIVPLVRTGDPVKGNRDPADLDRWPIDWRALYDDLWGVSLARLPETTKVWAELDAETGLVGRQYERWRAPLAVARLVERHGIAGLEETLRGIARAALEEAGSGEHYDLTRLVLLALCRCAVSAVSAVKFETPRDMALTTAAITEATRDAALAEETDIDLESITDRRVGRILGLLRFQKSRDAHRKGWRVGLDHLVAAARAHQVPFDGVLLTPSHT